MIRSTAATALFALALSTPAMAQGWGSYGYGMGAVLVDTNDDGMVTADEAAAHWQAHFALMDSDGDGMVTEDEFLDAAMPMGRGGRAAMDRLFANRRARFDAMDGNGDKALSAAEHQAAGESAFAAADANADGKVTVWEFRASNWPF